MSRRSSLNFKMPDMKTFQKRASKNFGIAAQMARQKAGKAKASAEPPEFLAAVERLMATKAHFEHITRSSKSLYDAKLLASEHNVAQKFLQTEIKCAVRVHGDYKKTKLTMDGHIHNLQELQKRANPGFPAVAKKLQDHQYAVEQSTRACEELRTALTSILQDIDARKVAKHEEAVKLIVDAYASLASPSTAAGLAPSKAMEKQSFESPMSPRSTPYATLDG